MYIVYSYKNSNSEIKQTIMSSTKTNIFNYYLSILLMAFIESNIFEVIFLSIYICFYRNIIINYISLF